MSTPAAIRFLAKESREPFTGLYIQYDANLECLVDCILRASKNIKWFPISIFSPHKRLKIREVVATDKGIEQKDLIFAASIEEYALFFNSNLFNLMNNYGSHYEDLEIDEHETLELSKEKFSAAEGALETLRLDSNYKKNIVYLVDIYFPSKPDLEGHNLENTVPIVKITTGVGKEVFTGTLKHLEEQQAKLNNTYDE
jgi:hypothetical protein